jgi:hypothetical protein
MKKSLAAITAIGCLTAAGSAFAGIPAATGVNGSLHDMTRVVPATSDSMGRVCVYCHTPHHAVTKNPAGLPLPLWNHTIASDDAAFSPYVWATPNNSNGGAFDIVDPLAGPSRICMSCHDGSIAVDEHGPAFAQAGGTTAAQINDTKDGLGRANLTKDLSITHPIGFDYNAIAAYRNARVGGGPLGTGVKEIVTSDNGYATALQWSDSVQGTYNTVTRNGAGFKTIKDNLYGGNIMTCATCHEVHNKENATQDDYTINGAAGGGLTANPAVMTVTQTAPNYFLYAKQTNSLICLSCHIK